MRVSAIDEHTLEVRLRAAAYAYFVHLDLAHEATRFGNNYIDLPPRQEHTIRVTNPELALTPELLALGWR
jgi:hypothetical protein